MKGDIDPNNLMDAIEHIATLPRLTDDVLAINVRLEKALRLYRASHDDKPPKDEIEFAKVLKDESIQLPKLENGKSYVYNPKIGKLLVYKKE